MEETDVHCLLDYRTVDETEEFPGIGCSRNMDVHDQKKLAGFPRQGSGISKIISSLLLTSIFLTGAV